MLEKEPLHKELGQFFKVFGWYVRWRLTKGGLRFENVKNLAVDVLLSKRGANTSIFVHFCVIALSIAVMAAGGVFSSSSVVSGSYPGVALNPLVAGASADLGAALISSTITPVTIVSDKPRDKIIEYEVKSGDTVSSIAEEFGVSESTIYWENNLTEKSKITPGDTIRILPVSGVAHKVAAGDSVYSIAKKYQANAQAIVDFPFNDIGDDFALSTGQILIVPDGAPSEKPKPAPTQYLARENISTPSVGSAKFIWPASGDVSQYFSWYHPGIDIANLGGGPISASDAGTVVIAGWPDNSGYGNRVLVDHGNGFTTLYAHMSSIYVSAGQRVSKGDVLGMMGSTGRSTGVHLHIEIRNSGAALNPLGVLGR